MASAVQDVEHAWDEATLLTTLNERHSSGQRDTWSDYDKSSLALYKQEMAPYAQYSRLSEKEREIYKAKLVETAREGLRDPLITYLLSGVVAQAERHAYGRTQVDASELVQVGNLVLLEKLEVALDKPDPCAYLLSWTEAEIRQACVQTQPMHIPGSRSVERPTFVSLDLPVSRDDDCLLAETLAEPVGITTLDTQDYSDLYEHIQALPKAQQETILRRYRLFGMGAQALCEIDQELHAGKGSSQANEQRALANLRVLLQDATEVVRPVVSSSPSVPPKCAGITLTEREQTRLGEAHARLKARQVTITVRTLAQEAHITGEVVSAYMHQHGLARKKPDRLARLDTAYTTMQARQTTITAKTLAREAHTSDCHARSYLQQLGMLKKESAEDNVARLDAAYQRLAVPGNPVTINALAKEAHMSREPAAAYLKAKRQAFGQPAVIEPLQLPPGVKEARHKLWLEEAYQKLLIAGKALTVEHLRDLVSVSSAEAKAFLEARSMTWKEQQDREREARLTAAYTERLRSGQPFAAEDLAKDTRTHAKKAQVFLAGQPGYQQYLARLKEQAIQDGLHRLTDVYPHFQPQGGIRQMTADLAKLASVSEAAARQFLNARAGIPLPTKRMKKAEAYQFLDARASTTPPTERMEHAASAMPMVATGSLPVQDAPEPLPPSTSLATKQQLLWPIPGYPDVALLGMLPSPPSQEGAACR